MNRDEARSIRNWTGDLSFWTKTGTGLSLVPTVFFGYGLTLEDSAEYVPWAFGGSIAAFVLLGITSWLLDRKFDEASKHL